MKLWDLTHYDRVNLMFDITKDDIIDESDLTIGINYSIDTIQSNNEKFRNIKTIQKDSKEGYNVEIVISKQYFTDNKVAFNNVVTDHDKKFHHEGYDVYGRWETEIGWGINGFTQDISKSFGFLRID